jgi:hypothetical protein
MSCGVIENFLRRGRRAFGRVRATLFKSVTSHLAILLPAILRADGDCPSRVSSSLVATDELSGRASALPLFQRRKRALVAIERSTQGRGKGNLHRGLRWTHRQTSHGRNGAVIGNVAGVLP